MGRNPRPCVRVHGRVPALGELAERLLALRVARAARHAEDVVVVTLGGHLRPEYRNGPYNPPRAPWPVTGGRPSFPRAAPPPRPAPFAAARTGERARAGATAGGAGGRPAGGARRAQPRPRPPRPNRRLPARMDRRVALRGATAPLRDLQQGPQHRAAGGAAA